MRLEDKEALEAANKLQNYCRGRQCNDCIFRLSFGCGCELDCDPDSYDLDSIIPDGIDER